MAGRQLTSFEQILLGLICTSPSSGYDLKRVFATPMGVYQPSSGTLYPALRDAVLSSAGTEAIFSSILRSSWGSGLRPRARIQRVGIGPRAPDHIRACGVDLLPITRHAPLHTPINTSLGDTNLPHDLTLPVRIERVDHS